MKVRGARSCDCRAGLGVRRKAALPFRYLGRVTAVYAWRLHTVPCFLVTRTSHQLYDALAAPALGVAWRPTVLKH